MKTILLCLGFVSFVLFAIELYCCVKLSGSVDKQIEGMKIEE